MNHNFVARNKRPLRSQYFSALFFFLISPVLLARSQVISTDVYEALKHESHVRVMITFDLPDAAQRSRHALRAQVQERQQALLMHMGAQNFRLGFQYDTIAAVAGTINSIGLGRLQAAGNVLRVDLDAAGAGGMLESLPLANINVVHDLGYYGAGLTVAVLDTGVDTDHPDLVNDIVDEHCFCDTGPVGGCCPNGASEQQGTGSAEDDNGHGTNVASIITSDGVVAPQGVAPETKLIAVKVMDQSNSFLSTSQIIAGLDWLLTHHPETSVVNMSLGTFDLFDHGCDQDTAWTQAFASAIAQLNANGTAVVVCSMNNGSKTKIAAPACISKAIAVGAVYDSDVGSSFANGCQDATTSADQVACFSNSSPQLDLLAPGAPITASGLGGGVSTYYGTSQAAPHVAGAMTLLLEKVQDGSVSDLLYRLQETGVPVVDASNGRTTPRIDVYEALEGPTPEVCDDGLDNDIDRSIDCADLDCINKIGPEAAVCEPTGEQSCTDGADNDNDGKTDCRDEDCLHLDICQEHLCADSLDNDGDGAVDCADRDCAGATGFLGQKCEPLGELTCDDGADNDGNSLVDCIDPFCALQSACIHSGDDAGGCGCTANPCSTQQPDFLLLLILCLGYLVQHRSSEHWQR